MDGWRFGDGVGIPKRNGNCEGKLHGRGPLRRCLVASLSGTALGREGWH